jgi:membrane protein implicated in regulation of membrane protease activity
MTSALGWLIVAVIFFIVEILTPVFLFSLFATAAFVVSVFAFFFPNMFYVQVIIFALLSFILVIFVRKLFLKFFNKNDKNGAKSNVDSMIGKRCRVVEEIDNEKDTGIAILDGVRWRAFAENNEKIETGKFVEIIRVDGTKLTVRSYNES